ncbi:uncharacterized protein RHOBADRAFT_53268 [Rhodotorula graminis WP1]|uniref:SH3 domain-containing protein n=1 Tax=Rhodotorula graminis (strain WP1) TaxID=578459 RepID=A0A194S778_RHOGW|nr:uncharacterized protein RHOBADRAFT_53268 [Rhodotorula graminis WP1]KPV75271.1 hypothetical protein RHOBADRAFT_53268 [Rhodotorula graminis WP1]
MAAVSFSQPGLLDPYNTVLSGGNSDWALYTLVGSGFTSELKFTAQGSGGLDELEDEFNDGKAMFAFCRLKDPNSGLPKFVLLGEGVPDQRKGLFPTHTAAVSAQLRGAHVTIQARSDADVSPSHILKRVSDSSGARYGVHNEPAQPYRAPAPVGSSYVPVGRPAYTPSRPVAPPTPVGTAHTPRSNELAELRAAGAAKAAAPPPAAPRALPGLTAGSAGLRVAEPATKPAPAADDDDDFAPQVKKPSSFAAPPPSAAPSAPAPSSTSNQASAASSSSSERPTAVGTSYTPVSLPKPGKLGNRWQAAVASGAQANADETPANATSGAGAAAGAKKPLTWSERQEQARLERERDDAASASALSLSPSPAVKAAGAAIGGTAAVGLAAGAALGVGAGLAGAAAVGVGAAAVKSAVDSREEDEEEGGERDEDGFGAPPPPPAPPARSDPEPEPEREIEGPTATLASLSLSTGDATGSLPPRTPSSGQRARALFDYDADEDNELSLVEGEVLERLEQVDPGWWEAENAQGKRGMFPSNYVELIDEPQDEPDAPADKDDEPEPAAAAAPPPPPLRPLRLPAPPAPQAPPPPPMAEPEAEQGQEDADLGITAVAVYDYAAEEDGELSFSEGQLITHINKVDEGWWMGTNADTGLEGLFPENYVEERQ